MTYVPELLIPIGTYMQPPGALRGKAVGVGDPTKIAEAFGRSYKPQLPLYLVGPDNRTILMVYGAGVADAAELEDCALAALDREKDSDWRASREARGLPQQETMIDNLRNLAEDTIRKVKQNRRTAVTKSRDRTQWQGGISE